MERTLETPSPLLYERILQIALEEDLGRAGDITTQATIAPEAMAVGQIVARVSGCIAGINVAGEVFRRLDPQTGFEVHTPDGQEVSAGSILATVSGTARTLLMGERTALNFLGHLSGIATSTREVVTRVEPFSSRVVCTRKTTPGLRLLEKYAVRAGGGFNHRYGLDDAVLVKENHLAVAGGVTAAVQRVRAEIGHLVKIEVEVESLKQLREALELDIDAVLLDNMSVDQVAEAVRIVDNRVITEVSGGITANNAAGLASTGVDLLSIGWLTHSSPALDVAFEITPRKPLSRPDIRKPKTDNR
jgi:nicotinate-nucleotide pyrophosphorylase (carboxylating)